MATLDPVADDPIAAWRALLLAHNRALRAIEREMEEAGVISLTWYDVLLELNAAPLRRLRMQDLGDRVVLSRSRVSRVVDDLVGAGLVRRDPDPTDGRATLATLTAPGRAALRQAAPVYMRGIERHFTGLLDADERQHVARALNKVVSAHDLMAPPRRR
jgi:DNA-binding MarR family transcriptional regulator